MGKPPSRRAADAPEGTLLQQAMLAYQAGRFDRAAALCEAVLGNDPDNFDALLGLAVVQSRLGRPEEALAHYDRAAAIRPSRADVHDNRGIALQELGRFDEALACHDRALVIRPDYPDAISHRAAALHGLQRFAAAVASYDKALARAPHDVEAWYNRGNSLRELKRFAEALSSYDRALALRPDHAEAHNNRGVSLQALRRFDDALASYDRAAALQPAYAEAHCNAGTVLAEQGDFDAAVARFGRAVDLRPGFVEARLQLAIARGRSLMARADRDGAAAALREALALDPDDRCGAALHLARLGDADAATAMSPAYVRALFDQYAPGFDEALKSLSYAGPARLREAVEAARPGAVFDRMLDLGCGTGLAGVAFRPLVRHLGGVDLSSEMVSQARAKQVYDRLDTGELLDFLAAEQRRDGVYDLIIAADVFVYLFDLRPVAAAVAAVLRHDGLFAFTVETHDRDDVELGGKLRYRHGAAHVREAMGAAGLDLVELAPVSTRTDGNAAVPGLRAVASRPAAP